MNKDENPETLLHELTPAEHELFIWLREAFSIGWIAETLMWTKRDVKALAAQVYKKLKVRDREELIAYYGALGKEAPEAIELTNALGICNINGTVYADPRCEKHKGVL